MFEGFQVKGNVRQVISRGEIVVDGGVFFRQAGAREISAASGSGRCLEMIATPSTYEPSLYNKDLAPIPISRRTWGTYNYASLWVAMSVCIPTYMLASGLIAGG